MALGYWRLQNAVYIRQKYSSVSTEAVYPSNYSNVQGVFDARWRREKTSSKNYRGEEVKLSEAIREGAKLRPQSAGSNLGDYSFNERREICSCAMGAAYEAVGLVRPVDQGKPWPNEIRKQNVDHIFSLWPVLNEVVELPVEVCKFCYLFIGQGETDAKLFKVITHVNDYHGWTREQIADWVEGIERQHGY